MLDDQNRTGGGRLSLFQDSIDLITKAALLRAEFPAEGFLLMLAGLAPSEDQENMHPLTVM